MSDSVNVEVAKKKLFTDLVMSKSYLRNAPEMVPAEFSGEYSIWEKSNRYDTIVATKWDERSDVDNRSTTFDSRSGERLSEWVNRHVIGAVAAVHCAGTSIMSYDSSLTDEQNKILLHELDNLLTHLFMSQLQPKSYTQAIALLNFALVKDVPVEENPYLTNPSKEDPTVRELKPFLKVNGKNAAKRTHGGRVIELSEVSHLLECLMNVFATITKSDLSDVATDYRNPCSIDYALGCTLVLTSAGERRQDIPLNVSIKDEYISFDRQFVARQLLNPDINGLAIYDIEGNEIHPWLVDAEEHLRGVLSSNTLYS